MIRLHDYLDLKVHKISSVLFPIPTNDSKFALEIE